MKQQNTFKILEEILEKLRKVNSELFDLADRLDSINEDNKTEVNAKIIPLRKEEIQ